MTLLTPSDIAPDFLLLDQTGKKVALYGRRLSGRPLVLAFGGKAGDAAPLIALLREGSPRLDAANIGVVVVDRETDAANAALSERYDIVFPLLSDADGRVSDMYGIAAPTLILLNHSFRVVAVLRPRPGEDVVGEIVDRIAEAVPAIEPREIAIQAPVLLIPDVLERDYCRRLIDQWESGGNRQSGFMRTVGDVSKELHDPSIKNRRDHYLSDPAIKRKLEQNLERRVMPEISKAFNFRVTRLEDLRIVCYDSQTGGYFRHHRDNISPATAHRRWAMTLNLNTDEYEGGHLRFPEYGPHLYRPPTGSAVVFSCSLLHEALDITSGRRFVLLSFLFGDEDERLREAYRRKVG